MKFKIENIPPYLHLELKEWKLYKTTAGELREASILINGKWYKNGDTVELEEKPVNATIFKEVSEVSKSKKEKKLTIKTYVKDTTE